MRKKEKEASAETPTILPIGQETMNQAVVLVDGEPIYYTVSCGNVFKDLELPRPEKMLSDCRDSYRRRLRRRDNLIALLELAGVMKKETPSDLE